MFILLKILQKTLAKFIILSLLLAFLPQNVFAVSTDIYTWLKVKNYTNGTDLDTSITADPGDTVMFHLLVQNMGAVTATNLTVNFTPNPITGGLLSPGPDVGTYRAYHYNNDGGGSTEYIDLADLDLDGSSGGNGDYTLTPSLSAGGLDQITYLYVKIPTNYASTSFNITATPSCDNGCNITGGGINVATVNVNVQPVIVSNVTFSPGVIANNGIVSTNLTADVSDPLAPSNITSVTIDLSSIGGSPTTPLYDDGFNGDGAAGDGEYGALNITSTASTGTYSNLRVTAIDGDSNQATADGTLILIPANAPVITLNSNSTPVLSTQAGFTQTTINWQSDQDCGTGATQGYRVELGGNGTPTSGTELVAWDQTCFANTPINTAVNNTDINAGSNSIYIYVSTNPGIGYNIVTLEKDITAPTVSVVGYTPTINTDPAEFRWQANENGTYTVRVGGDGSDPTSGTQITGSNAGGTYTDANASTTDVIVSTLNAGDLSEGANTVYAYLTDDGGNVSSDSATITKDSTPRLSQATNITLSDNDSTLNSWLDGRDFTVTWTKPSSAHTVTHFTQYNLYILPEGTTADSAIHSTGATLTDINTETWTGTGTLTLDGAGNAFATGNYVVWLQVMSDDVNFEDSYLAPSPAVLINSEVPTPPVFQSATFVDDTTLQLTFDSNLNTNLNLYTASGITSTDFTVNTGSGTNGIDQVSGQNVFVKLNSLGNPGLTSVDLNIASGSIVGINTGINAQITGESVADGQSPTLTFTSPASDVFTNGAFTVTYQLDEAAQDESVRLRLQHTGGTVDPNNFHTIILDGEAASTLYNFTLTGTSLTSVELGAGDTLINGAIYSATLVGKDLAGNSATDVTHLNFGFDTEAPAVPVTLHFPNQAGLNGQYTNDTTPLLNWFSTTDNLSATGGLLYNLQVAAISDFSVLTQNITNLNATSQELNALASDSSYYWRVNALDQSGNAGNYQNISEYFILDTTLPVITTPVLTDQTIPSILYTKNGNTVVLTTTITDTNRDAMTASDITVDLTNLGGTGSTIPASYNSTTGVATWTGATVTCADGNINIPIDATDPASNNALQVNASITCDNTAPVVAANTITSANGGENWQGGSTHDFTWNSGGITETNLASITLQYSANNGTSWTDIATGEANDGTYNWNPIPSLNSAQMLLRVVAIDQVTQTGSDVSDATFIIDSTSPTMGTGILLTPNGGNYIKGGSSYDITWTAGEITDTYLTATPITLEYYDGSAWVNIASNEANDGSYTWNPVPSLDITTARVRITATDTAGNTSTDESNSNFTIDSTLPTITEALTQDLDGNGQIDAIRFTFLENISDATVVAGDFDIVTYNNEAFNATLNGDVADNNIIYLTFDEAGIDTAAIPNYTYTQGTLTDLSGNLLASTGATASTDGVKPILLSRETQDTNGDGQLDGVLVTFSENMDASATSSTDFSATTSLGVNLTESYTDAVDDTTLLLEFTNGDSFNTSDLTKIQLSGTFQDLVGNTLIPDGGLVAATDGATPVFSVETWIASITPAVRVTFSENVDSASDDFTDWAVAGFNVTAMDLLNGTTNITLLSLDANITDTSLTPNVTYTAGDVQDTTGNALQTATVVASDSLSPNITKIEIYDLDSDGSIETAYIEFSENINDASLNVAGFTLGNSTADNFSTNAFGVNTINDHQIAISLNTGITGTITRDVLYSASVGGLTDASTGANLLGDLATGDIIEADKAGPALISATYNDNGTQADVTDDTVTLSFSEDLDDATLDTGVGNSDLEFAVANGGSIANTTTTSGFANDETLTLSLAAGDTALTAGVSTIALQAGVLADSGGNTNTNVAAITLNGAVIINEIMWMGTTLSAADEYLELKNMSSSPINISGWIIDNAATGTGITLPGGSIISANGFFLISNFNRANSQIDLDPDWVTTSLDLSDVANGNLILNNTGAIVMDSVKGDTWPAGDNVNKYSMERNIAPGDGLQISNWHTADAQSDWDGGSTERGTPGTENVADSQAPTFQLVGPDSRLPAHNSLFPHRLPTVQVAYADNVGGAGIDTNSIAVYIDLNNDADYDDANENITAQTTITDTQITYNPSAVMAAGKYTVRVVVADIAGNSAETTWIFWLDSLTVSVENTPNLNFFAGIASETQTDSDHIKVTIQTYGAGVNLKGYLPLLTSGGNTIQNWDNTYGVGWDVKEGAGAFTGTIQAFGNTAGAASILATKAKLADGTYSLQTYTFYIKVYGEVNALQDTGFYQNNFESFVELIY